MKINNLVSIIIPTYNRIQLLKNAIDKILIQSYKNIEIIIINDMSTDGTKEYLDILTKDSSIFKIFHNEKKQHVGLNRLTGYRMAKGRYIIFHDDDDYYTDSNFIFDGINILSVHNEIAFYSANSKVFNMTTLELYESKLTHYGLIKNYEYFLNFQIQANKPNSTFTTIFNNNVLNEADFYNMEMMNDSSIYLRSLLYGDAFISESISGVYLVHQNNISKALNLSFFLGNLEEKKRIYFTAKRKNFSIKRDWLINQFKVTLNYFFLSSKINFIDFLYLSIWLIVNRIFSLSLSIILLKNSLRWLLKKNDKN
jgi:glycosyltransferase involved in cell wall biosynthesis